MTRGRPTDVAASAFNRLKALTRSPGQDFNLTRSRLAVVDLADACHGLRLFLEEPIVALERGEAFELRWAPGGPWTDRDDGIVSDEVED